MQDGILLIDKPAGMSSFGVVARVRRILSEYRGMRVKVGHAGTLDPFATGLLIIMVGSATKQADRFLKLDKTYEAVLRLGATSTTGDPEGEITVSGDSQPSDAQVLEILRRFEGTIEQTPPIFSAIKVNGQRAYKLARKGQAVHLEPRSVTIHSIGSVAYAYPTLNFMVAVSSGTYIRSLAVDIGDALGTGAYLTELRRTRIAHYDVSDALILDDSVKADDIIGRITSVADS